MQPEAQLSKKIIDAINKAYAPNVLAEKNAGTVMGGNKLDISICLAGLYLELEVKMPGKKPTDRQRFRMRQVMAAGGRAGWTDSVEGALAFVKKATGEHPYNPEEKC